MSNDIIKTNQSQFGMLDLSSFDEGFKVAEYLAQSAMIPKSLQGRPADVFAALQMGLELGVSPMQALQNIAVINGRPCVWGDLTVAIVKAHPDYEWMKIEDASEENGRTATCIIKRKGEPETVGTFSMDDAKRAGLLDKQGPWKQYPKRMLLNRARAFACRDAFPDALKGIRIAEEQMDVEEKWVESTVTDSAPASDIIQQAKKKREKRKAASPKKDEQKKPEPSQPAPPVPTEDEQIKANLAWIDNAQKIDAGVYTTALKRRKPADVASDKTMFDDFKATFNAALEALENG